MTMAGGVVFRAAGGALRYGAEFAYTDRTGGSIIVNRNDMWVDGPQPWHLMTFFVGLEL
ncbi:MAG: hypothetical protein IPL61_27285 [Myxococcales bacterium]|nr:hypothetical protein [Myxococcales bacterium]